MARIRLEALGNQLKHEIGPVENSFKAWVSSAISPDERVLYHAFPINETARYHGYFANRQAYSSWVQLNIGLPGMRVELLIAFHVVGHTNQGVYVASACGYHRDPDEGGNKTVVSQIEPLSDTPFQFSYHDELAPTKQRFGRWLEDVIPLGLSYWERSV
jgi:hypothetical protein